MCGHFHVSISEATEDKDEDKEEAKEEKEDEDSGKDEEAEPVEETEEQNENNNARNDSGIAEEDTSADVAAGKNCSMKIFYGATNNATYLSKAAVVLLSTESQNSRMGSCPSVFQDLN